jgi:hypothetical protein
MRHKALGTVNKPYFVAADDAMKFIMDSFGLPPIDEWLNDTSLL